MQALDARRAAVPEYVLSEYLWYAKVPGAQKGAAREPLPFINQQSGSRSRPGV
jgi:hypothetical protein